MIDRHKPIDEHNIIFEALENKNVIDEDHLVAYRFQQELNLSNEPFESKMRTAGVMVANLDKKCHHTDKEVIVTGKILTKEIDLKGIDFVSKDTIVVAPEAMQTQERIVEDAYAISRGYVALYTPRTEEFTFYQIIDTKFYTINIEDHGTNVTQSGLAYVPLDNTTYVSLVDAAEKNKPNNAMLDIYIPDVLDAVDEILHLPIDNHDALTTRLRYLNALDLKSLSEDIFTDSYAEIREHLEVYISTMIDYATHSPYYITGARSAYIMENDNKTPLTIPNEVQVPGYLNRVVLDETSESFGVEAIMPFSDGSIRTVRHLLTPEIDLHQLAAFPAMEYPQD